MKRRLLLFPSWPQGFRELGRRRRPGVRRAAFTVLELMTVIIIIAILVLMILPLISDIRARIQKANCMSNLKSLHIAAQGYIQDNNCWPQIRFPANTPAATVAGAWIPAFQPYGLLQKNWICPTIQGAVLHNPDLSIPANARIDYTAYPYGSRRAQPFTSFQITNGGTVAAPWFFENVDVHGNGQLIIFADGHIEQMGDLLAELQPKTGN